jgi:hypothetical protein
VKFCNPKYIHLNLKVLMEVEKICKNVNGAGAVCDQKILVFVLQMEESKQNTWMGWVRIASLMEGSHPFCQVRKREKGAWWVQVESTSRESFSFSGAFKKPTLPHGRADPGGSHQIMNEWGRAWAIPSQEWVRMVHPQATYISPKLFLLLSCLEFPLRDNIPKIFGEEGGY